MDGYLQTGLASSYSLSPYASRSTSTSTTGTSPTTAAARLLQPFPPTNKDFECKELHTPDGTFPLACEIYASTIHPQFAQGTQCSVVCNLKPSSSSSSTRLPPPSEFLAMTPVSTDTTTNGTTAAAADSSEDENGLYFGLDKHVKKSMALPIPNATASRHYHHRPIASSSSSSVEQQSGTLRSGTHHGGGFNVTPSTSTTNENASGEKENDFVSTSSLGANSSVGSLSSLFSRNSFRQSHHNRRPRNSLAKTKSSFILRVSMHDQLQKILASRTADDTYVFYNQGTSFIWADGTQKVKEHLCKIVFTKAYPTCHNVNKSTCTGDNMDIIIGFSTGDLIWLDPVSSKYSRLNKGGIMCNSAVTAVKWIPGSEDLFMASFKDGTILVLDKDRDDQAFTPDPPSSWADQQMQVSRPPRKSKNNPISHWKASSSSISDFEFSPDGSYVAVVSGDGTLKIIDYHNEHLCDIFAGYYGKLNCVAWSPDGHYLLTGGQDDLVSLWSVLEKRIVARCQGHTSWITSVAFDSTRCDDKVYRFGSVGEDCKLMLWDFSFSALHRPRHKLKSNSTPQSPQDEPFSPLFKSSKKQETKQQQQQPSSFPTFSRFRRRRSSRSPNVFSSSGQILGGNNNDGDNSSGGGASHVPLPTLHPILNKDQVPFLQPITAQTVHADPCSHLSFHKDYITTADRRGRVRMWSRQ